MANYNFETITAEQALDIRVGDYLTIAGGPANSASVAYSPADLPLPGRIEVTFAGRTVTFGEALSDLSLRGGLEMGDHSRLLIGGPDSQHLFGWERDDALFGGGGNDSLDGAAGDDLLHGNSGDDLLNGGAGANTIYGGQGDDAIYVSRFGETKGSWAHGNQGNDDVIGGAGHDTLYGGKGDDFIGGGDGHDWISGDQGNDEVHAGSGNDTVNGGEGDDRLYSTDGSDLLLGGDGGDMLVVYGRGQTLAHGGAGADTIVSASLDQSVLYGGEGRDVFEIVSKARPGEGFDDIVADWESGDHFNFAQVSIYSILPRQYSEFVAADYDAAYAIAQQHIMFAGATYAVAQVDDDVIVFADTNGDSSDGPDVAVVLVGASLSDISYANFV